MCGLIGIISNEGTKKYITRRDFFKEGLFASVLRGDDSTGIFMHDASDLYPPVLVKKAISSVDFIETRWFNKAVTNM